MNVRRFAWLALVLGLVGAGGALAQEAALEGGVNPGYHAPPAWFKDSFLDLREDLAEASAEGRRLLLYFYQDGCPYCAKLLEDNFGQKAIADKTRSRFDVVAVNMWGDREVTGLDGQVQTEKEFATAMRVMFTPTLVFLNEGGAQVLRVNGYYHPHKFDTALDYASGKAPAGMSFPDFLAEAGGTPAKGELNTQAFFQPAPHNLARDKIPAGRPLVVFFEQRQCGACDELHGDVLARAETRKLLDAFDVVQLDMRTNGPLVTTLGRRTTAAEWAHELNVMYAPSLVFFDERGKEVFRTEAYLKSFHVQSALDYVASGAYKHEPSFQRFVQARADRLREQGIVVDLMD
ncbi:MAG: thioredoxin fold domain-containing protein [Gammaproteobacteria bacterium]|nr:thioredoxin fold domain-containing protein [Gammaproteobacteria bacterium]